jgi:hypothetical protein
MKSTHFFDHFIVIGAQLHKAQVDMNVGKLKTHLIQFEVLVWDKDFWYMKI